MEDKETKKHHVPGNSTHTIVGQTSALVVGSTVNYTCVPADGQSYLWQVSGGAIIAGQGLSTITVTWTDPVNGVVTLNVISDIVVVDTSMGGGIQH